MSAGFSPPIVACRLPGFKRFFFLAECFLSDLKNSFKLWKFSDRHALPPMKSPPLSRTPPVMDFFLRRSVFMPSFFTN